MNDTVMINQCMMVIIDFTGRLYIVAYIIMILLDAMVVVVVVCVVVTVVVVAIFAKMNNE